MGEKKPSSDVCLKKMDPKVPRHISFEQLLQTQVELDGVEWTMALSGKQDNGS